MKVHFELDDRAVLNALDELVDVARAAAESALHVEGEMVASTAIRRYIPRDLGALAGSGQVETEWTPEGPETTIAFGGLAAPYAAVIHEFPGGNPPPSWRGKAVDEIRSVRGRIPWSDAADGGRGPKYLARALDVRAPGIGRRVGRAVERAILDRLGEAPAL